MVRRVIQKLQNPALTQPTGPDMNPQLNMSQTFDFRISQSDAALLFQAIGFAESETNIKNCVSDKSYQRLKRMSRRFEDIATTLVTYTE